jgi:hypothetical protein
MINPKGMDELFWGKEFKYVLDWIERLKMASDFLGYDEMN